jgi:hypothetical protein
MRSSNDSFEKCAESPNAVYMNDVISMGHRRVPISTMALHTAIAPGTGVDATSSHGPGLGLMAVAAQGLGVGVLQWGVEKSPEIAQLRILWQEHLAQQDKQRQKDDLQRQLKHLQQKLNQIDRLKQMMDAAEARSLTVEEGMELPEALTEEQLAKLNRREQVVEDIKTICRKLGQDPGRAVTGGGGDNDSIDPELAKQLEIIRRKREKARLDCVRSADKKVMQKDRSSKREQKTVHDD